MRTPTTKENVAGLTTRREFLRKSLAVWAVISIPHVSARADQNPWPRFLQEWGKRGKAEGEFDIPIGIAINRRDGIFVTEFLNNRTQKFNTDGNLLALFHVPEG